jgi:hypothetical protein
MRVEIGYVLLGVLAASVIVIAWMTRRYSRSEARRMRGHYDKPVRRPFWMP